MLLIEALYVCPESAGVILLVILFLSHQLSALPQPVLAAVVLTAVGGLLQVSALGVLVSGLLRGVMDRRGHLTRATHAERGAAAALPCLAESPAHNFSDLERHPDNKAVPGALIFRPETSLVYFNVDHVCAKILDRVRSEAVSPNVVVIDMSAAPHVDLQSAHTLAGLADEMKSILVRVVETRSDVRDRLRREELEPRLGAASRFFSVADALDASRQADQNKLD